MGIVKCAGGYQWAFSKISRSELLKNKCVNFGLETRCLQKRKRNNPVVQLSLDGEFIALYGSSKEASEITRVSRGNISSCLNNKRDCAGGFRWIRFYDWGEWRKYVNGKRVE